jgi:dTDP-4-dehydrorhamnose 3,5-epimerase
VRFSETPIRGALIIEPELRADSRGYFARTWCQQEWAEHGLPSELVQCSISFSPRRGTLRGLHYQAAPHEEVKLVRVTRGAALDVVVDLRPDSPTFRQWHGVKLTADNHRMVLVPRACAHGLLTLADDTDVSYQMSRPHREAAARGVRFDDPALGIDWPEPIRVISERDRQWPLLKPLASPAGSPRGVRQEAGA